MITAIGIILLLVALGYSMVFKIPDVHYGLPSSLFGGRFKGLDETGNSIPINKPYAEGFHLKAPWWKIELFNRAPITRKIVKREFVVKEAKVFVSGVIQYRPSRFNLYRYQEVDEAAIFDGLDSEINQIVGNFLVDQDIETALDMREQITQCLWDRLTGTDLNPKDVARGTAPIRRTLFGHIVTYAEQSYGIEILKSSIDTIDPPEELSKARDSKQKERYEKESQTTEWNHIIEKMQTLKDKFPALDDKLILEAVQVWQKQTTKEIKEFKIADLKDAAKIVASLLEGRRII